MSETHRFARQHSIKAHVKHATPAGCGRFVVVAANRAIHVCSARRGAPIYTFLRRKDPRARLENITAVVQMQRRRTQIDDQSQTLILERAKQIQNRI